MKHANKRNRIPIIILACIGLLLCACSSKDASKEKEEASITEISVSSCTPVITNTPEPTATPIPTPEIPISTADPNIETEKLNVVISEVNEFENNSTRLMECIYIGNNFVTFEDELRSNAIWADNLSQHLSEIDREALPAKEQSEYDTLRIYLNNLIQISHADDLSFICFRNEYGYLKLPLILYYYSIDSMEDAQKLIDVLNISPNYFNAVKSLLKSPLSADIENEISVFLSKKFKKALSERIDMQIQVCPEMERKDKKKAIKEIQEMLNDVFFPSIKHLTDENDELQTDNSADNHEKDNNTDTEHRTGIDILTESVTGGTGTEEAIFLLENNISNLLNVIQDLKDRNPSYRYEKMHFDKFSNEKTIQRLKKITEDYLKSEKIEEIQTIYSDVSICDITVPVFFNYENIWLNSKSPVKNQFFEIAMQTYPGTLYLRSKNDSNLKFLDSIDAYKKGWGRLATEFVLTHQNLYDSEDALFYYANETMTDYLLPSLIYLYANVKNYSLDEINGKLINVLSLYNDKVSIENCMYSVNISKYITAIAYSQLSDLFQEMSSTLGNKYIETDVLNKYLTMGPSYYSVLREKMDTWASEQSSY